MKQVYVLGVASILANVKIRKAPKLKMPGLRSVRKWWDD